MIEWLASDCLFAPGEALLWQQGEAAISKPGSQRALELTLDEQQFEALAGKFLARVTAAVEDASDDIDVELQDGVLTIELEDGRTFVLNKHGPMRQMWLSSPLSGASHYNYDDANRLWVSTRDERELASTLTDDFARAGFQVTLASSDES